MFMWFYGLLMWAVQPLLRIKLARRGKAEPGYLEAVEERFGHYPVADEPGMVWLHAVSLGETRAAAVLITALRKRLPGMRLLLTHGTATGRAEGRNLLKPGDLQVWQPWDAPGAVDRFLTHFRPSVGVLMETEIWPRLCAVCAERHVPLVLANARLSEKSLHGAQSVAVLMVPAYRALAAVYAQTESDAERLRQIEAPVQGVFGNLKFDATPDQALLARGQEWRALWSAVHGCRIALFASSRDGEEAALLQLLQQARQTQQAQGEPSSPSPSPSPSPSASALQWLIVPRHPQRFDEVAALIEQHGFTVARRSSWPGSPSMEQGATTIWLGDSLGEMAMYYGLADVALLGGSFEPLGGQNLIEAAACGCPVVMGPHTFNFLEAAQLAEAAGAALRATDLADATHIAARLAANPLERDAAVHASLEFSAAHRGAAARTADAIAALLPGHTVVAAAAKN